MGVFLDQKVTVKKRGNLLIIFININVLGWTFIISALTSNCLSLNQFAKKKITIR